jgi:glycosyltransferase involved in cell wall biosynthesis
VHALEEPPDGLNALTCDRADVIESPFYGGSTGELKGRLLGGGWKWSAFANAVVPEFDIVLYRVPSPHLRYVAAACRRHRRPLVLVVSGHWVKASVGIHKLSKWLRPFAHWYRLYQNAEQKRIARKAQVIFACGSEIADEWGAVGPVTVWQDGHLDTDSYLRRRDTCQNEAIRIVRVCELSPPRGVETAIRAVAQLTEEYNHLSFDIIGDGHNQDYIRQLKELSESLGIAHHVRFLGWQSQREVIMALRQADLHVVSSLTEGMPRVILEGFANSVPLVCTKVGGVEAFVRHEENCLMVPPSQPSEMADALRRLIVDPTLRQRLIGNGFDLAEKWQADITQHRLVEIVTKALSRAR